MCLVESRDMCFVGKQDMRLVESQDVCHLERQHMCIVESQDMGLVESQDMGLSTRHMFLNIDLFVASVILFSFEIPSILIFSEVSKRKVATWRAARPASFTNHYANEAAPPSSSPHQDQETCTS